MYTVAAVRQDVQAKQRTEGFLSRHFNPLTLPRRCNSQLSQHSPSKLLPLRSKGEMSKRSNGQRGCLPKQKASLLNSPPRCPHEATDRGVLSQHSNPLQPTAARFGITSCLNDESTKELIQMNNSNVVILSAAKDLPKQADVHA